MRRALPPLNGLKAFEAAARHLSFTRAADELAVTPAAVSQQVRALEERLAVTLFERHNNTLELTETGRAYLPFITAAFDQVSKATSQLQPGQADSSLELQVMPTFGERWLLSRMPEFSRRFPGIDIRLSSSPDVGVMHGECELAIWYGQGDWPGFHADKLFDEVLVPVASPGLLEHDAPLPLVEALFRYPLLRVSTTPEVWRLWLDSLGAADRDDGRGPRFDTCGLAIQAAVHGLGIMLANRPFVASELDHELLVEAFRHRLVRDQGWYLVRRRDTRASGAAAAFHAWLLEAAPLSAVA